MRFLKVLLLILFFFVSMVFFFQNTQALSEALVLRFDPGVTDPLISTDLPFYVVILISFVIGSVFSLTFFLCEKLRLSRELKAAKTKLADLEQEVTSLRNLPLENQTYSGMQRDKSEETQA